MAPHDEHAPVCYFGILKLVKKDGKTHPLIGLHQPDFVRRFHATNLSQLSQPPCVYRRPPPSMAWKEYLPARILYTSFIDNRALSIIGLNLGLMGIIFPFSVDPTRRHGDEVCIRRRYPVPLAYSVSTNRNKAPSELCWHLPRG